MLLVCLPTYNERDNLERMLRALEEHLGTDGRVLVIDDNSPDGTGQLADGLAADLSFVDVLHRPRKEGLGPAYVAGFQYALRHGYDLVLQIDCDFSHDPADVPRLVAASRDADLVVGSRYLRGGSVENWNLMRRLLSRAASLYARVLLRVPVHDMTSGFKCYRREVLERLGPETIESRGMVPFQVETTYRALRAGFRVVEVPITFVDRVAGGSKMNMAVVVEAAWKVPALRLSALAGRR